MQVVWSICSTYLVEVMSKWARLCAVEMGFSALYGGLLVNWKITGLCMACEETLLGKEYRFC
jgi:hypothetical protein